MTTDPATLSPVEGGDPANAIDDKRMSFLDHLAELRTRLRNAVLFFLGGTIVGVVFVDRLFDFLTRPVRAAWIDAKVGGLPEFTFMSLSEPFWVYTKLALMAGLLVSAPFILWELWRFIAPGLYRKEKRLALLVAMATGLCFSGGALFGYSLLCYPAAKYLLGFAGVFPGHLQFQLRPTVMMNEIFSFQMMLLAGCGVAFELPVVLGVLGWMGMITSKGLWRFNRFAIVLAAIVGGVLTPGPDVLSQVLMAGPLFGLYNLSILVVWLLERRRRRAAKATA